MALRPLSQVSCVVCIVLLPVLVQAQQPTGTITGVVRDPSGAIVPGASITIVHEGTQSTTRATTSNAGVYSAPGLLPGLYKVCVEATGFKQTVVELEAEVNNRLFESCCLHADFIETRQKSAWRQQDSNKRLLNSRPKSVE